MNSFEHSQAVNSNVKAPGGGPLPVPKMIQEKTPLTELETSTQRRPDCAAPRTCCSRRCWRWGCRAWADGERACLTEDPTCHVPCIALLSGHSTAASGTYRRISRATTWHADVKPAISCPAVRMSATQTDLSFNFCSALYMLTFPPEVHME